MGLDVFVGSFTRYYSGRWQTVIEQMGDELGMAVEIKGPAPEPDVGEDPVVIHHTVLGWRSAMAMSLGRKVKEAFDWDESVDAPYFTDKPGWEGYGALVMWASHVDRLVRALPETVPERFEQHEAFTKAERHKKGTLSHLARGPEFYFPVELKSVEELRTVAGKIVRAGSTLVLRRQLRELNAKSWRADEATIDKWLYDGPEEGYPLEPTARFGFALFLRLAETAVEHRLPMILDY